MASQIDLTKFSFEGELLSSIGAAAMDDFLKAPEVQATLNIVSNILIDKEVGFVGEGTTVGLESTGCNPTVEAYNIASRALKWEPVDWIIFVSECWANLKGTVASITMKAGIDMSDISDDVYMQIATERLTESMKEMFMRLVWLGDKDAALASAGGLLTAGVNPAHLNLIDGFFKQMEVQVTANPDQLVTITENAGANYAAQALISTNVQGYLKSLYYGAPVELRALPNQFILATQTFYDGYEQSLQGTNIESMYVNLIEGVKALKFNGVPVIPMPFWDKMIKKYEDNGTTLNNPHRAIYTSKDILGVGVDSLNSLDYIKIWYDEKDELVYSKAKGKLDAKLRNPELFTIATGVVGS